MNEFEYEKLFTFNKVNRKYKIKLTDAVKFLLSKQRVIEAKYHFMELEKINPNHKVVMELGFDIGIKTFDRSMAIKYHNLLEECKEYNKHDFLLKRIVYWLSINQKEQAISDACAILDDIILDNDRFIRLYNIIHHELKDEYLIIKANNVLRKKNLKIVKG